MSRKLDRMLMDVRERATSAMRLSMENRSVDLESATTHRRGTLRGDLSREGLLVVCDLAARAAVEAYLGTTAAEVSGAFGEDS